MRLTRLVAVLLALLVPLLAGPAAFAHAQRVGSVPAEDAVLPAEPAAVVLTFNEPVAVLALAVVTPDGRLVPVPGHAAGTAIELTPPAGMAPGTRTVSYRVMSEDGHPVAGTLAYSVGTATGIAATASEAALPLLAALLAGRWASLILLAVAVGGAAFLAGIADVAAARRVVVLSGVLLPAPLALWLGATAIDMVGGLNADAILGAAISPTGRTIGAFAVAALIAIAAVITTAANGRAGRVLALAALLVAAGGFALSGHAATALPQGRMMPVVALHAAAALVWAGALLPLAILVARYGAAAAPAVVRFSVVGIAAVLVLLATGPVLAVVQVGDPARLIGTAYGRVLLVKLALVAVLLAIAALNRLVLTPRLAAGAPRGLRRALAVDLVVMAAVFAAVAGWRVTPPPRALIAATQTRLAVHIHTDKAMADITLVPGRAGPNRVSIVPLTADFAPLAPKEVQLELVAADGTLAPVERAATPGPDGSWRVASLTVPYSGRYRLRLRLLIDDFTEVVLDEDVTVP